MVANLDSDSWTYGAEHELSDWPRDRMLPAGWGLDERDVTMVNTNGIAVDPRGISWRYGGEFNSPPTNSALGQEQLLVALLEYYPECSVNYRSNLRIQVMVPGLREDLVALKKLAEYGARWLPEILPVLEPIPPPTAAEFPLPEEYEGARRRWRRRRVSHHTVVRGQRLASQLRAA